MSRDGICGFRVKEFFGRNMRQWHCAFGPQCHTAYAEVEIIPHEIVNPDQVLPEVPFLRHLSLVCPFLRHSSQVWR
jgi:hypothetical protein